MKADANTDLANAMQDATDHLRRIGDAITPNVCGGNDASGGCVTSLTEAVMGVTAGLFEIASAIQGLAEAVRETSRKSRPHG